MHHNETGFVLVLIPEKLPIEESVAAAPGEANVNVCGVIVNRVLPISRKVSSISQASAGADLPRRNHSQAGRLPAAMGARRDRRLWDGKFVAHQRCSATCPRNRRH
jgi:hypothetical protein